VTSPYRTFQLSTGGLIYRLSILLHLQDTGIYDISGDSGRRYLDEPDSSTVCDYADVYGAVRDMRIAPIGLRDFLMRSSRRGEIRAVIWELVSKSTA